MKIGSDILFIVLVLSCGTLLAAGFVPNRYLAWTLNALSFSFDSTITHRDMTRSAILEVAADVLRDNPNPASVGSSQRISALSQPDEEGLVTAYYGEIQRGVTRNFENVIEAIQDANSDVDLGAESRLAEAHFDSETFQAGHNRLVELRQIIVSQIMMENFATARREAGRMLHTLQDFYSHSNWIENGHRSPYSVLGRPDERGPSNIASPRRQTCDDCQERGTVIVGQILSFLSSEHQSARKYYACQDNIILQRGILTSGYHGGQRDNSGQIIDKPRGKCSHGGFLDATSDSFAKGGINKDSPFEKWSPHYYYYDEAVLVAQQATVDILQEIRRDVDDDLLFGEFLGLTLNEAASIAYVIDTTGSMDDELPEIQATIPQIRASLQQYVDSFSGNIQVRYILVPFNDPDPGYVFETDDIEQFLNRIADLVADGGGDTPEPSIGALIRAIESSEPGSPIYVFTDAPASDSYRFNEAIALISRKEVTVSFALVNSLRKRSLDTQQTYETHSRSKRQTVEADVYEQLAQFSGGQVLNIRTHEISDLASLVGFSARQSRSTIFRRSGVYFGRVEYSFPMDSFTSEAIISINGQNIAVSITSPQGISANALSRTQYAVSLSSSSSYIANINITDNSLLGEWGITLQSQGSYTINVLGNTELSFSDSLYKIDPSSTYGFSKLEGKPSQGVPIVTLLEVEGDNNMVVVSMLNLINEEGMELLSINNLTAVDRGSYVGVFLPPSETFQLQLIGRDGNGYNFSHIIDTSVEVAIVSLSLSERDTGFITIRPGGGGYVTLILLNGGQPTNFSLTANVVVTGTNVTDFFEYTLIPAIVFVESDSSTEVKVQINVSNNATDGLSVTFSVIAQSENNEVNNFITFDMVTTTAPPPKFKENEYYSGADVPLIQMKLVMTMMTFWLTLLYCN